MSHRIGTWECRDFGSIRRACRDTTRGGWVEIYYDGTELEVIAEPPREYTVIPSEVFDWLYALTPTKESAHG